MNQTELQQLYDLAKIAGERQLHQPERLALSKLANQAVQQVIGQSKRIQELKLTSYQSRRDGREDPNATRVPDFLSGLFGGLRR